MGSLLDLLGGELVDIVDYAVDHHRRTGRPPIFGVNANSWWYSNLSRKQAQEIRDRSGVGVNPVERNLLFFTIRMLHLGLQLHFVFDGPKRLHNGGKTHPGYDPPSSLMRETLTKLAVPWHESPGEADAECARMEELGIIDAIWSDDGDALAYGCKALIRSYREIKLSTDKDVENKSTQSFLTYTPQTTAIQHPGMNRAGYILNSLLIGGESGGIPNFEPRDVLRAARDGLGRSLDAASGSKSEFHGWVDSKLKSYLEDVHRDVDILREFPTYAQLEDYTKPCVSTREVLLRMATTQEVVINQEELFTFLANNFQWTINRWAKWIVPLLIVRSLLATKVGEEHRHDHLRLKCDLQKRPKKAKATFILAGATSIDLSALREETFSVETLTWILRRARLNGYVSITSYFTPPQSERTSIVGTGIMVDPVVGSSTTRPPPFHITVGNPSQMHSSRARQATPPSPTPARRRRPISSRIGAKTTKNIAPQAPDEENFATANGKGKGRTENGIVPQTNVPKRGRSHAEDETMPNKKAKAAVVDLTSPPSSSESSNCVLLTPQSEEDYGSAPTSQDLQAIPINFGDAKSTIIIDDSDSEDNYGSFPSSPEIRALLW